MQSALHLYIISMQFHVRNFHQTHEQHHQIHIVLLCSEFAENENIHFTRDIQWRLCAVRHTVGRDTRRRLWLFDTKQHTRISAVNNNNNTLRAGLTTILNVDLMDDQWIQASLPVRDGGLGIRSVQMLAPSAFLASAASILQLQQSI